MIIFFIVLTILFLITLLFFLLLLSNIEIEINKFWFDSNNRKHEKLEDYLFYIRLKLLDRITWFKIKIDNKKIIKFKNSKFFKDKLSEKLNRLGDIKNNVLKNKKDILKINNLKELNIRIKQLEFDMQLCASNNIITSFSVAILASIISIFLARSTKKKDRNKYQYRITPIYGYKPSLKIKLSCIIDIKIVHIINVIYMLIKKRSGESDERTSNRRTYVYSNE